MGVWIEIGDYPCTCESDLVTPFMGVWIEITMLAVSATQKEVTPFMGVWIEIIENDFISASFTSLPLWECGLK